MSIFNWLQRIFGPSEEELRREENRKLWADLPRRALPIIPYDPAEYGKQPDVLPVLNPDADDVSVTLPEQPGDGSYSFA